MPLELTAGIVVCAEPLAAVAGQHILERGGSAIDAAIAAAYAQGVVNPMMCGIGGTAELNLYLARSREHLIIEGLAGAGSRARPDTFEYVGDTPRPGRWRVKDKANYIGYKAAIVPTFVRVTWEVHRLFGRLPWEQLLEPAIELATNGFEVWPWLANRWNPHGHGAFDWPHGLETLNATQACARIYLKNGQFYGAGDTLIQSDYAQTLRQIAAEGASTFYEGEIGRAIAEDYAANGGLITYEDLLACHATLSRPLQTTYHGYSLHGRGAIRLLMYNILEGFDLRSLGHNTPKYLDILGRSFQIAHVDRARYKVDPNFGDMPTHMLISKSYAASLRYLIESGEDIREVEPGSIPSFNTTALVAMDAEGNTVAMRHSNGNSSGVVTPGLGFLYNNHMHNFNPRPGYRNSVAPGKKPESADGPLIVCADGQPFLAVAHYSKAGTTAEVQVVLNMIDFGMPVEEAVAASRIYAEYRRRTIYVDPDFPSEIIRGVEDLNTQKVVVQWVSPAVSAVHRQRETGRIRAGFDPRAERGTATGP